MSFPVSRQKRNCAYECKKISIKRTLFECEALSMQKGDQGLLYCKFSDVICILDIIIHFPFKPH